MLLTQRCGKGRKRCTFWKEHVGQRVVTSPISSIITSHLFHRKLRLPLSIAAIPQHFSPEQWKGLNWPPAATSVSSQFIAHTPAGSQLLTGYPAVSSRKTGNVGEEQIAGGGGDWQVCMSRRRWPWDTQERTSYRQLGARGWAAPSDGTGLEVSSLNGGLKAERAREGTQEVRDRI